MSKRKHRKKNGRTHHDDEAVGIEETGGGADPDTDPTGSGRTETAETESPSAARVTEDVEGLAAQVEEMRDLALRKQAEFENFRKRVERERSETVQYAASELVKEILPVLDNLERALTAAEAGGGEGHLREGVEIIYKQFKDILERRGLAEVASDGEAFDPHVHEAVSRVETDDYPEGSVVEVFQRGYRFKDRLLRPAMVSVALPASGGGPGSPDEESSE